MIVAVTGHRPNKIGGYDYYHPQREWIRARMRDALRELTPTKTISGMALGVDQDFAQVSIELAIPFIAAVPFIGQDDRWPSSSQEYYWWLMWRADEVVAVTPGVYTRTNKQAREEMQIRNQWMVNHCDVLIAIWDGSSGGTGNCVRYAERTKPNQIYRINPKDF
jgi:uncharacterized phage-like protein YoqJ